MKRIIATVEMWKEGGMFSIKFTSYLVPKVIYYANK